MPPQMREAMLYERLGNGAVRCNVCAFRCIVRAGARGVCLVRGNVDGTLHTLVYGRTVSQAVDPVEKKPLFHFHAGSATYSIATAGCNLRCRYCQNWQISQAVRDEDFISGTEASPEQIVSAALRTGCRSVSYTYTEPAVFFEYAYDTARLAHEAGLANVFVTNGYETPEALEMISPFLDAANVDLKSFSDAFYRRLCTARLEPVLDTLRLMKELGIWLEVTTLIIPTINDGTDELGALATFLAGELGPDTPWHVTRYRPDYMFTDEPVTPLETLERAYAIGREAGLRHVYVGNVPAPDMESTYCHHCGDLLIERRGHAVLRNRLEQGRCPGCATVAAGVWR